MKDTTRRWLLTIAVALFATQLVSLLGAKAAVAMGLQMPVLPDGTTPAAPPFMLMLAGTLLLVVGMAPLTAGLSLSKLQKGIALSLFLGWCYVLNTVIEAHLFSTLGGEIFNLVTLLFTAVPLAVALAMLAPEAKGAPPMGKQVKSLFASRTAISWTWRLLLAILSFPIIYAFFGGIIYPLIKDVYNQLGGYLHTPPLQVVLLGATARGVFFVLIALPILAAWKGSRRALKLSLGLAFWVAVGGSALLSTDFLPARLRWVHSIEILADGMVHAWALVALLGRRK